MAKKAQAVVGVQLHWTEKKSELRAKKRDIKARAETEFPTTHDLDKGNSYWINTENYFKHFYITVILIYIFASSVLLPPHTFGKGRFFNSL